MYLFTFCGKHGVLQRLFPPYLSSFPGFLVCVLFVTFVIPCSRYLWLVCLPLKVFNKHYRAAYSSPEKILKRVKQSHAPEWTPKRVPRQDKTQNHISWIIRSVLPPLVPTSYITGKTSPLTLWTDMTLTVNEKIIKILCFASGGWRAIIQYLYIFMCIIFLEFGHISRCSEEQQQPFGE